MIRTTRKFLNPLLWGLAGYLLAVVGNIIGAHFTSMRMIHADQIFVGLGIGLMRWLHEEWEIDQVHRSSDVEIKIRNALQVLYQGEDPATRRVALDTLIAAFEEHRPVHEDILRKGYPPLPEPLPPPPPPPDTRGAGL
jgi:hypothetical protein